MKLTTERKSLTKQQIIMCKITVYTLVNGHITLQKHQISGKKVTLTRWPCSFAGFVECLVFGMLITGGLSSTSVNGDIAIQWEWSNFDHS